MQQHNLEHMKKQKLQQQSERKASVKNVVLAAEVPAHWDAWESTEKQMTVQYVVLPLSEGGPTLLVSLLIESKKH